MRFTVDSNILVYALDRDDPAKRKIAYNIMSRGRSLDMILTAQALGEFVNVMRRKRSENWDDIVELIGTWTLLFPVAATSEANIRGALIIAERYKLQWWDSVILDVAQSERVSVMLTEDMQDGMSVAGVTLLNPFVSGNESKLAALLET